MKTVIYNQLVSCKSNASVNTLTAVTKSAANKAINERHQYFCADKKATANELKRVYSDWFQVYRRRPTTERIVLQSQVDTLSKMEQYLAPLFACGEYCTITTSEKRAAEAVQSKVSAKTGKTHYLVPVKWTVASLEAAVKYAAKYYAGTESDIETKLSEIK